MIFKSYLLENNIKSITDKKVFLFYGENEGLKNEFKKKLKIEYSNYEIINYFQEELIKNIESFFNEINNKSLFKKEKIIFIDQVNDKILEIIKEVEESIQDERVFIFSSLLDKRSKLRSYFEKSKNFGISACYQDNEITIKKIIVEQLKKFKGFNNQIVNTILLSTGLDRNRVNNEIEKINCCFQNKELELNKIESLLNLRLNDDFDELKDEAINGNKFNTNKLLSETVFENENMIFYINSINQRINKLFEIEREKKQQKNIETIVSNIKPPIFWKDKPKVLEQSRKWNSDKLNKALQKTYKVELALKSNAAIKKDLLIKNLLVELCADANSS